MKVGLHLPHESTWRVVLQAAQVAGLQVGDVKSQVSIVKELKRLVHRKQVIVQTHLTTFPVKPTELEWFDRAYQDSPPKPLDEQACMMMSVTLRTSKAEVKDQNPKALSLHAHSDTPQQSMDANMNMMMKMWQMFNAFASVKSDATGAAGAFADINLRPTKRQKALGDAPAPAAQLALTDGDATARGSSTDVKDPSAPEETQPSSSPAPAHTQPPIDPPAPSPPPASMVEPQPHAVWLDLPDPSSPVMKKPAAAKEAAAKPKPKAAPKGKPSPKANSKGSKGSKGKSKGQKEKTIIKCSHGWTLEIRHRESGQKHKHYKAPDGSMFRILADSQAYGFPGEP